MTPGDRRRLAALKTGLAFAGPGRRAEIKAMIAELEAAGTVPPSCPALPESPAGDWRAARRALRRAGHEVKQFDGVVYVDGARSRDPRIEAPR